MAMDWNSEELEGMIRQGAMQGVMRVTEFVHEQATKRIQNPPKTGRIYRRRGKTHQASAPGQPPATDTGSLASRSRTEYDAAEIKGTAIWSVTYARPLEFGTARMAARPFARPSLAEGEAVLEDWVGAAVRAQFDG